MNVPLQAYAAGSPGELILIEGNFQKTDNTGRIIIYRENVARGVIERSEKALAISVWADSFAIKTPEGRLYHGSYVRGDHGRLMLRIRFGPPLGIQFLTLIKRSDISGLLKDMNRDLERFKRAKMRHGNTNTSQGLGTSQRK